MNKEDRLQKIIERLEALTFRNGKCIVLLDFIQTNFSDILHNASSPPTDPDIAMTNYIRTETNNTMFYLVKKDVLEISTFVNGNLISKKFKVTEIAEMREFLLQKGI